MKLWGNGGGRTENRNTPPPPAQPRPAPRQPAPPAQRTGQPAQPNRTPVRPAQPRPTGGKEPFEIDWDAVWKREEELRRLRQQGDHSQDGQIPDFVLRSQAGRAPVPPKRVAQPQAKAKKKKKKHHWLRNTVLCLMMLVGLYCVAVFSNIPFIAKWRTIYIETAMSTMTHQWLATAFIPPSVIQKVEGDREKQESEQLDLESNWNNINTPSFDFSQPELSPWEKLKEDFFQNYPEIEQTSFEAYMEQYQDQAIDENGYLLIDKAGLEDDGTEIETIHGDQVLAVDTANGLTICRVEGEGYVGRLAIIKDPAQVGVTLSPSYGSVGSHAADIAEKRDAVLLTNASGFFDPEGHGNGGVAHGLVISEGKRHNGAVGGTYKAIGLDQENRLHVGAYKKDLNFRDAVEFKPALIIDGEQVVKGSAGWGVQPRTAIGQTSDGTILLLVVDGRAPGYSIGCTVGDCAEILGRYGAVQACNLDGGSSSIMVYNGRVISRPSAANKKDGRHIPNGIAVYRSTTPG